MSKCKVVAPISRRAFINTAALAGAAALAALTSGIYRPRNGERVGVLICGGNTTAVDFSR
jgi:threonine dehydratase